MAKLPNKDQQKLNLRQEFKKRNSEIYKEIEEEEKQSTIKKNQFHNFQSCDLWEDDDEEDLIDQDYQSFLDNQLFSDSQSTQKNQIINEEEIKNIIEIKDRLIYENFILHQMLNSLLIVFNSIVLDIEKDLKLIKIDSKKNLNVCELIWDNILNSENIKDEKVKNMIPNYIQKWEEINSDNINSLLQNSKYKSSLEKLSDLIKSLEINNNDLENEHI